MALLMAVLVTLVVTVLGGGLAYLLWMKAQPRKIAWTAFCYQLGEGIRDAKVDPRTKKPISELRLQDLRPYIRDVLERIEEEHARTVHKLVRLNLTTNAVTADMVDVWGNEKHVHVLISGDTATVMKKGFDTKTGNVIFSPMPRERIDLIQSNILIKKDRLKQKKDILQAITPWIVAGICILGLIAITYMLTNSYSTTSKSGADAEKYSADKYKESAEIYRAAISELTKSVRGVAPNAVLPPAEPAVDALGPQEVVPPVLESETPSPGNMSGMV